MGNSKPARVIVTHFGAIHNYAVPRMLQRSGSLSRFYTDLVFCGGAATCAARWVQPVSPSIAGKVRRRIIDGVPWTSVYSAPEMLIKHRLRSTRSTNERNRKTGEDFGHKMINWGLGDANIIYGIYGSGVPFWRYARQNGLKVAVEINITPLHHRIVAQEQEAYPDWAGPLARDNRELTSRDEINRENIEAADVLLCPSETVAQDLVKFTVGQAMAWTPPRIVVPYGIRVSHIGRGRPVPGRILFAGTVDIRKGIHYLAEAATKLNEGSHKHYEFRVAGFASDLVRRHPRAKALTFLGHLSREQIYDEYRTADVFVLPTLAEGSATVVYEALAAGLPVVTTLSAGSVVISGHDGLIVPERDALALTVAIERIVKNRELREFMAQNALLSVASFDEAPWGGRLVQALETLLD